MKPYHRYIDAGLVVHACEGGYAATEGRSPYLVWTLCDRDVPANQSYKTQDSTITCRQCKARKA